MYELSRVCEIIQTQRLYHPLSKRTIPCFQGDIEICPREGISRPQSRRTHGMNRFIGFPQSAEDPRRFRCMFNLRIRLHQPAYEQGEGFRCKGKGQGHLQSRCQTDLQKHDRLAFSVILSLRFRKAPFD